MFSAGTLGKGAKTPKIQRFDKIVDVNSFLKWLKGQPVKENIPLSPSRQLELLPDPACCLLARRSRGTSRSEIFGIVRVPSSILAAAARCRHDGPRGSLAAELSLCDCCLG